MAPSPLILQTLRQQTPVYIGPISLRIHYSQPKALSPDQQQLESIRARGEARLLYRSPTEVRGLLPPPPGIRSSL